MSVYKGSFLSLDILMSKLVGIFSVFKKYYEEVIIYREEEHEDNPFSR